MLATAIPVTMVIPNNLLLVGGQYTREFFNVLDQKYQSIIAYATAYTKNTAPNTQLPTRPMLSKSRPYKDAMRKINTPKVVIPMRYLCWC